VMAQLHELHRAGHTIILITHDAAVAAEADRTIQLRDGVVVDDRRHAHAPPPATGKAPHALPVAQTSLLPDVLEAVKMAMRSLRTNLFRTVLTLLGIIIGVGAVVAMLALGDGSKAAVLSRIEAMGTDLLIITPGARNVRTRGEKDNLVAEDAEAIADLPNVREALAQYGSGVTVRYGGVDYTTECTGTTANFARVHDWTPTQGSFFAEADVKGFAPVAVLGQTVADNLFRNGEEPIGKYVLINNIPFQVIGVLAPKGANAAGKDLDDNMFVPLSTARMRLFGKRYVYPITVQVADMAHAQETEAAITALLTERHRKVDFQIRNMASLLEAASETQNTLTLLLGSIAAISLLVGGIGVMNIMLVSVTERIREIGIRMATGARMLHILLQFMTEALVVCAVGGAVGVAGGLAAAWIAGRLGSPVIFSLAPVVMAFGSAFLIGLLFGFLPARRAARMDPVVALATE
ncbi:MAG TPA: ABC transporter permease, partial [Usitatibacteraceae bacterium]|nr:ABC transporter permease [Usitatibacteraceae bacterium]